MLTGLVASAAGIQGSIQGSIRTRAGTQGVQFDKEHPLDWDTLNATRGFCGLDKCYFPSRLSEHEAGQACWPQGQNVAELRNLNFDP